MVRGPSVGPLPKRDFSDPIHWRIPDGSTISIVPMLCQNAARDADGQSSMYRGNPHRRNKENDVRVDRGHRTARKGIRTIVTDIRKGNRKVRAKSHKQSTNLFHAHNKTNLMTTPRVHARVTRNNTPGIIPTQTTTPIMNTEGETSFSHNDLPTDA